MLQNDVADLERNVLALETKMNAAPSSEVLLDKLKSVQTLVQDAKNRVSALEDVRNLPKYENELDTARDALRTARHAVDNFRTELKKNLEETGQGSRKNRKRAK
jgi:predicted  nucleic acid-binding Zn-ribbon protein